MLAMRKLVHQKLNSSSISVHRRPPARYGQDEYADTVMHEFAYHVVYNVCQIQEPKSLEEALATEHADHWRA